MNSFGDSVYSPESSVFMISNPTNEPSPPPKKTQVEYKLKE